MERTSATGAAIALGTDNAVCCRASTGAPAPEVGARLHAGISLTGLCLGTGEIMLCNDTNTDPRVDPELCNEMGIRSVLVSPIKDNAEVVGVLEVVSISPNAFNQYDLVTMSKLADQILPVLSESAKTDQCHDHVPSKNVEEVRNLPKFLVQSDVSTENNGLASKDAAEVPEWNGDHIGSQFPNQPVTMMNQELPSDAGWLRKGFAATLALALIVGYGYHLKNPRVAKYVATLPIATANDKPVTPERDVMSEEEKKSTGLQPDAADSVLTATRQELILAIQEAVPATDQNGVLNRADAGDSRAQYEIAIRYADGEGVAQDYQEAMTWFSKAAENGNNNAQWKLGLGYIKGIGVPHDEHKAAVWFKRAANHGDVRAQRALSDLYLSGRGVPRDYVRAYTWASIATASRGDDSDRVSVIGSRMTAAQIAEAERRISIWWTLQMRISASAQKTAMPYVLDKGR